MPIRLGPVFQCWVTASDGYELNTCACNVCRGINGFYVGLSAPYPTFSMMTSTYTYAPNPPATCTQCRRAVNL